jgi:hypothetical protein
MSTKIIYELCDCATDEVLDVFDTKEEAEADIDYINGLAYIEETYGDPMGDYLAYKEQQTENAIKERDL